MIVSKFNAVVIVEITLPDAVNFIMKLTNHELLTLGNNLGLDEARVKEIISLESYYDPSEQHQRLVELWFRQESNPTWEKLQESLPSGDQNNIIIMRGSIISPDRRESSAASSMVSVPITPGPLSPTGEILQPVHMTKLEGIGGGMLSQPGIKGKPN